MAGGEPVTKKTRFVLAAVVVVLAFAVLVITGMRKSGATLYYFTVDEFWQQPAPVWNQVVRVNGEIVPGSVHYDPGTLMLTMALRGSQKNLPVVYHGAKPDYLDQAPSAVVEGKLGTDGVFQADQILLKCPSKYESGK